ncbi:MAG: MarR family transcriptional regulator, partial [Gillisia sp.]
MNIENQIKTSSQLPASKRLLISLIYTANQINDQIGEALKPFDLSIPQFNVLRILRGQKGKPANLNTIQERMVSKM